MVNIENDLVFFIVTYRERYYECETFNTLVQSYYLSDKNEELKIFIYDNTPNKEFHKENFLKNVNVKYFTNHTNDGLSVAYNFLAEQAYKTGFKWIVLLDQDTSLPLEYYQKLINIDNQFEIYCPKVYSRLNLISPAYYKNFRSYVIKEKIINNFRLKKISCINSGLLINLGLFKKIGGYNENIKLDFCDHDFVDKVKKSGIEYIGILNICLEQDFSSHNHTKDEALFRYSLFVRDLKAFRRNKSKCKIFFNVDLSRLIRLTLKYKTFEFFYIRIRSVNDEYS